MRALSIVQWHHFAYMIISVALLGYGASGVFIALLRPRLRPRFEAVFSLSALLFSIAMVCCFALGQRVPFNALAVIWDFRQLLWLGLLYLLFFVPFFLAAICVGLAFTFRSAEASRIYFVDLLGAGTGAVIVIGLLFLLIPQNTLLALTTLPLVASAIMCARIPARRSLFVLQLTWLAVLFAGVPQRYLDLNISEYKGLSQQLQVLDSRLLTVLSSPLGLVSVVESPTVPVRHAPGLSLGTRHVPPQQLAVFTDGDGISAINRFDGNYSTLGYLADVTAALPYALLDSPKVLVLGAGGGGDVLLALYHGARSVDAVELNPQMSGLVTHTYADFAGHLYARPRVSLHTKEARGFVAQSDGGYDLVHIGLLDSFGAAGAGVQALNESYIYTVEALRDYLRVTAPGGYLAITRWLKLPPRDSLKLLATAAFALREDGEADPGSRIALLRSWNTFTLLVKNGAMQPSDIATIRDFAASKSFDTAWFPGIEAADTNLYNKLDRPQLFDGARVLLGDESGSFLQRYKFSIEPATDDRPHFFQFFKWGTLREVLALRPVGGGGLIEWGYIVVVATLVQATLAGLLLVVLPLCWTKRTWPAGTAPRMGAYFLLLGLAFLFIEIAYIQTFILFLSHPLYSVAVVLSSFLAFAGVGSALTTKLADARIPANPAWLAVLGIVTISLAYLLLLPWVFDRFIGAPDAVRILVSVLLIAPLALCMGMPFPLGLTRLADEAPDFVPWAWGINGFASVVSAVLATLIAIEFGFRVVIVLALILYVTAAWIFAALQLPAAKRIASR